MAEPVRARRLTDQEGSRLRQIVRQGKHGSIRVRRAMIIMASASGTPVPTIARLVAADEDTVRDVIHLFNAKGLAALDPRWAGGRVLMVGFTADPDVLVSAAADGTVRSWSLTGQKQLAEIRVDASLQAAALDASNGIVLSASAGETMAIRIPAASTTE